MVGAKAKILMVDDSPEVRHLLRCLLGNLGHEPMLAASGEEAVGILRRGRPDLLITDLSMPGMDGMELIAWVRKAPGLEGLPVLVYSGEDDEVTRRRLLDRGVARIIGKPGTPHLIREAVTTVLAGRSPAAPAQALAPALLVDGGSSTSQSLEGLLADEGYHVLPERGFREAVDRVCREGPPLLTVLDFRMDPRASLELVRLIRAARAPRATRVLMLLRDLDVPVLIEAARAGVDQCLVEPVTRPGLRDRLRELGLER